jgi:hypothetical protein
VLVDSDPHLVTVSEIPDLLTSYRICVSVTSTASAVRSEAVLSVISTSVGELTIPSSLF